MPAQGGRDIVGPRKDPIRDNSKRGWHTHQLELRFQSRLQDQVSRSISEISSGTNTIPTDGEINLP
jgi:hypothetical protein